MHLFDDARSRRQIFFMFDEYFYLLVVRIWQIWVKVEFWQLRIWATYFARMLFNICFEFEYFDLELSLFASSNIQLRLQRFAIRFGNESWSGTPLCLYLLKTCFFNILEIFKGWNKFRQIDLGWLGWKVF